MVPWKVAKAVDLIRLYRTYAFETQHRQFFLPIDQRSRHLTPDYPVSALTGHSARRRYATNLSPTGVGILTINRMMSWAQGNATRMLAAYDANTPGTEIQTCLRARMLIGSPTHSAPLPTEIFETGNKFPTWKEWLFAHLHPDWEDRLYMRRRQLNRQDSHLPDGDGSPTKKLSWATQNPRTGPPRPLRSPADWVRWRLF